MTMVGVRRALPDDIAAVIDLFVAVVEEGRWLGTQGPVDRDAQYERFMHEASSDDAVSLVAVVDDEIVGHVRVELAPYKVAGLGMMVDARWRRRGPLGRGSPAGRRWRGRIRRRRSGR